MIEALTVPAGGCDCPEQVRGLIPVDKAIDRVHAMIPAKRAADLAGLAEAAGRTLSRDVCAPRSMPFFDNSAMDGFAVRASDLVGEGPWMLPVIGPVAAGDTSRLPVPVGPVAVRIFTGAPVPVGFDAVVMQEDVGVDADRACILEKPRKGQNIRLAGEDVQRGAMLVRAGTRLDARHIGLLAASGHCAVNVVCKPRVGVFSTGDELLEAGHVLTKGQIYDANRPLLLSLAVQAGAEVTDLGNVSDTLEGTIDFFNAINGKYDLVISSGAVSVGGHDYIKPALERSGGEVAFWRVAMKPGKPVMFGRLRETIVAGLPGNSLAAYIGFKLFVEGMITALSGQEVQPIRMSAAVAGFEWTRRTGRTEYFPVRVIRTNDCQLPVLERLCRGGSASLFPLCQADGIGVVDAEASHISAGTCLNWHPIT